MKKLLLLFLLTLTLSSPIEAKKIFAQMRFEMNRITLDDGTSEKPEPLKNKEGKEIKFLTLVSAFNYMSLNGWEFVCPTSVTSGSGHIRTTGEGVSNIETKVYYLFCKEVSEEELVDTVQNGFMK